MARMPALALLATVTTALAIALAVAWLRARSRGSPREPRSLSMRRLALLAENAHDILLMFDDAGRIVEANSRAVAVYGWPREALLRLDAGRIRAEGSRGELEDQLARALAGERFTFETVHQRRTAASSRWR